MDPDEMITIPRSILRDLVKWTYAYHYWDSGLSLEQVRQLTTSFPEVLEEVIDATEQYEESDDPFKDYDNV